MIAHWPISCDVPVVDDMKMACPIARSTMTPSIARFSTGWTRDAEIAFAWTGWAMLTDIALTSTSFVRSTSIC